MKSYIKIILGIMALPTNTMAYAGPVDRYHDMLYSMMDGLWPLTIICAFLYTIHLFDINQLKWLGLINKWIYIVLWSAFLIILFSPWPIPLGMLVAPFYLWVILRITRDRRAYPEEKIMPKYKQCWKWLYRCCAIRAIVLTIPFWFMLSIIQYVVVALGEFIQSCVFDYQHSLYRYCRDTIFDSYSIDINYISGIVLLFSFVCLVIEIFKKKKDQVELSKRNKN